MLEPTFCCQSFKGNETTWWTNVIKVCRHDRPSLYRHSVCGISSWDQKVQVPSYTTCPRIANRCYFSGIGSTKLSSSVLSCFDWRDLGLSSSRPGRRERFQLYAALDVASAVDVINDLGLDTLTFLAVTVLIVPAFRTLKASPVLGFFFAGVVLNQFGLIRNLTDVKVLSEWGVLFLVRSQNYPVYCAIL